MGIHNTQPNLCCEPPLPRIHFSSCFVFLSYSKRWLRPLPLPPHLVQCCSPFLEKSRSALISRYPEAQLSIFCLCGVCSWPPGASPPALALQQASRSSSVSPSVPLRRCLRARAANLSFWRFPWTSARNASLVELFGDASLLGSAGKDTRANPSGFFCLPRNNCVFTFQMGSNFLTHNSIYVLYEAKWEISSVSWEQRAFDSGHMTAPVFFFFYSTCLVSRNASFTIPLILFWQLGFRFQLTQLNLCLISWVTEALEDLESSPLIKGSWPSAKTETLADHSGWTTFGEMRRL